jgi:hypothetical protein
MVGGENGIIESCGENENWRQLGWLAAWPAAWRRLAAAISW